MASIIEIKGIGKKYNITHQRGGYIALRDVLAGILKNPFKFAKHKAKQVVGLETKEEFWALRNVSLEIQKGDIVGIIGHNGAGKSTLLKILTGITPPTEGEIIMRGRVASLLEVGTGFHPELTGRENIFLNGAILGMTKKEIARKFDEIVAFSGVEKFLDTPVKYYSSGMYVRLAFSVAAHMEPDILLVDEVLAVGDAEFQKKCLGKMEEVTKKDGRTILFVSHNTQAIEQLCEKCVLLENGRVKMAGETGKVLDLYFNAQKENIRTELTYVPDKKKDAQITKVSILNKNQELSAYLPNDEKFFINIEYEVYKPIQKALLAVSFFHGNDHYLLSTETDSHETASDSLRDFKIGKYKTTIEIPSFIFVPGLYYFNISIQRPFTEYYIGNKQNIYFEVTPVREPKSTHHRGGRVNVIVSPVLNYHTQKLSDLL